MTLKQLLVLMDGLRKATIRGLISKGSADGIIQNILEERGFYGFKKTEQKE
jgi:hypothetical protein